MNNLLKVVNISYLGTSHPERPIHGNETPGIDFLTMQ